MYIEIDKYCWNSLRKGRLLGFQNDVEETFTIFKNYMLDPQEISIRQFGKIASLSQFQFLIKCRAEQQDEQEYVQLLYQILIGTFQDIKDNYFMTRNTAKQIFAIFGLYFLYCQLQRKRRVNVDMNFLDECLIFFKNNATKTEKQWMIVAKKLIESCLSIGIKTGLKTYLVKPNGEPARKGRYIMQQNSKIQNKEQEREEEKAFLNNLKGEISNIQISLSNYSKLKEKFNHQHVQSQNKLVYSDKNLAIRLLKKYNQYEKLLAQKHSQQK